jgi:hypothetical protein
VASPVHADPQAPALARRRIAGRGLAMGLAAAAAAIWLVGAPVTAGAATAGTAEIIVPGQTTPLKSGGSATSYGVALPAGASCPGDTAHQGYHVYSYLVPAGVSPTAVSFRTGDPSRWYGFVAYGDYYGAVNTEEGTGQITTLPDQFTWSRFSSFMSDLFPHGARTATWEGGIACADTHGVVTDYWNAEVAFTKTASDPGGFTWRVLTPPPASDNTSLVVGVVLVVLAVGFAVLTVALRRRQRAPRSTDPSSGSHPEAAAQVSAPCESSDVSDSSDGSAHRPPRTSAVAGR